ncbi:hypothetical protein DFO47_103296 [Arthrobacter sp. AG258]|nr:hypothetical protein DFO47_103296 [Arthrobacter sp. AG258]
MLHDTSFLAACWRSGCPYIDPLPGACPYWWEFVPAGSSPDSNRQVNGRSVGRIEYQVIYVCNFKNVCEFTDSVQMPDQASRIVTMTEAQT